MCKSTVPRQSILWHTEKEKTTKAHTNTQNASVPKKRKTAEGCVSGAANVPVCGYIKKHKNTHTVHTKKMVSQSYIHLIALIYLVFRFIRPVRWLVSLLISETLMTSLTYMLIDGNNKHNIYC